MARLQSYFAAGARFKSIWLAKEQGFDVPAPFGKCGAESGGNSSNVGTKLRAVSQNGQFLAGKSAGTNDRLATTFALCKVIGPCGSTLPASHMHLLFRTPSFRGQACVSNTDLPAFFFAPQARKKRRETAQRALPQPLILNNNAGFRHLLPKLLRNQKGQYTCESHEYSWQLQFAAVLPPAETQPANKHCLAAAQGRSGQRSSTPTRFSGLRSAQRATCSIARPSITVTDADFSGRVPPRPPLRITPSWGCRPSAVFLRFQNTKTKDVPCSIRS